MIVFGYKEPFILLSRDRPRPSGNTTPTSMLRPICNERKIPLKTVRQTLEQKLCHILKRKMHVVKEHIVKKNSTSDSETDSKACQALGNSKCKAEKVGYRPITLELSQLNINPSTMGPFSTKAVFKDSNLGPLTVFSLEAPIKSSVDHALCSLDLRDATGTERTPKLDRTYIQGGVQQMPPPQPILQTPGKTALLPVLPSMAPLDLHQINSLEKPIAGNNEYSLCRLSAEELREMQNKTNQLNQKRFSEILREYHNNQTILLSIRLQVESLRYAQKTPQIAKVMKEVELEFKYQKEQEVELQLELQKISTRRSDIYPAFTMPKKYGSKGSYEYERIQGIPIFDPADKNTRLSHTWAQLKILASAPENDWSKEGMKSVLYNRLKGEAVDYFYEYQEFPLEELIVILSKRFETHEKKADFEEQFESFERSPKESLLSCITRLQYIVRRMLCDSTTMEKHVMEKQFLRIKLKKIIPKLVWQNVITLENTRLETGESFDLVHEIQIAEKSYDESFGKDLNSLNTSLQKLQTSSTLKQNPSKKANSSSKGLADGPINVEKGQIGQITDSNQGHKVRSRTKKGSTPYPSPKGSRNHSPERSDPNENFPTEDNCLSLYGHSCNDQNHPSAKCSYCFQNYHYDSDLDPDPNRRYEQSYHNDYDHFYENDSNHYDYAQAHENNCFDNHENDDFIHSQQDCPLSYQ